jgi:hypothetical protein
VLTFANYPNGVQVLLTYKRSGRTTKPALEGGSDLGLVNYFSEQRENKWCSAQKFLDIIGFKAHISYMLQCSILEDPNKMRISSKSLGVAL